MPKPWAQTHLPALVCGGGTRVIVTNQVSPIILLILIRITLTHQNHVKLRARQAPSCLLQPFSQPGRGRDGSLQSIPAGSVILSATAPAAAAPAAATAATLGATLELYEAPKSQVLGPRWERCLLLLLLLSLLRLLRGWAHTAIGRLPSETTIGHVLLFLLIAMCSSICPCLCLAMPAPITHVVLLLLFAACSSTCPCWCLATPAPIPTPMLLRSHCCRQACRGGRYPTVWHSGMLIPHHQPSELGRATRIVDGLCQGPVGIHS